MIRPRNDHEPSDDHEEKNLNCTNDSQATILWLTVTGSKFINLPMTNFYTNENDSLQQAHTYSRSKCGCWLDTWLFLGVCHFDNQFIITLDSRIQEICHWLSDEVSNTYRGILYGIQIIGGWHPFINVKPLLSFAEQNTFFENSSCCSFNSFEISFSNLLNMIFTFLGVFYIKVQQFSSSISNFFPFQKAKAGKAPNFSDWASL